MKREPDLIRLLLLQMETGEKPEAMNNYSENQIVYHCKLCIDAGLLEGEMGRGYDGMPVNAAIKGLTWAGHDFLDAARDENLWKKAMEKSKTVGGSWTIDGLKLILFELVRRAIT